MDDYVLIIFLLLFDFGVCNPYGGRFSRDVKYYEPIVYPYLHLREDQEVKIYFHAFEKDFHLILRVGNRVFDSHSKLTAHGLNKSMTIPTAKVRRCLVTGFVNNIADSSVYGYISDGVFVGVINVPAEIYYIERSSDFLSDKDTFQSIVYRYSDVITTSLDHGLSGGDEKKSLLSKTRSKRQTHNLSERIAEDKLSVSPTSLIPLSNISRKICSLRLIVDHLFHRDIPPHTLESIISRIILIINQVDDIFRGTDFDQDGIPDGIGFKIADIEIWWNKQQYGYKHYKDNLTIEEYVRLLPYYKTSDVCFLLAFTARKFVKRYGSCYHRMLGKPGGICSLKTPRGQNLNVGAVSVSYRGKLMPNSVTVLHAAHILGHAFGSEHDVSQECLSQPTGPYLMTDGPLNVRSSTIRQFSPCSKRQIHSLFTIMGFDCFEEENQYRTCGNGIVDSPKEECDCGLWQRCNETDFCCTSPGLGGRDRQCTYCRSKGYECSFREDACCNFQCKIISASEYQQCNEMDYCKKTSFCNGIDKDCPIAENKPDGTSCRKGFGICINGSCQARSCYQARKETCESLQTSELCFLSCMHNGWCYLAGHMDIVNNDGSQIKIPDGERCLDGAGYCRNGFCDVIGKGVVVDNPLPFASEAQSDGHVFGLSNTLLTVLFICILLICVCYCICVCLYCTFEIGGKHLS